MNDMPIGTRAEVERVIEFKHTLAAYNEALPPVLSTPHMIGLMEHCCFVAQEPFCGVGEITVGTAIHVEHRAPAAIGSTVKAEAILDRIEGRFFIYRVRAWNEFRDLGMGTVHRAVVDITKFRDKFQRG
jgi:fluoroacetyl-CoA thioesterase